MWPPVQARRSILRAMRRAAQRLTRTPRHPVAELRQDRCTFVAE
jgi:hypothetical protein